MLALEILSTRGIVAASKALKFANQNDLVPMVSFYLEEDLIDRVMKNTGVHWKSSTKSGALKKPSS